MSNDQMSLEEASAYLAMEKGALTALASERGVPCQEVNGTWVFSRKSLDKWRTQKERRRG
jgi:hypothetical protein